MRNQTRGGPSYGVLGSPATLLVLFLGVVVCRLSVLTSNWGWDTGAWMYISRLLHEGRLPYIDVWDNKLPPIFWVGLVYWKTGVPHLAMFVTEVALTLLLALLVAALVRRAGIATPWSHLFGALFVCSSMPVWEYPHRLETYALAPLALGVWLLVRATTEGVPRRGLRVFLAGVLVALAASFRPQHAVDAVLLAGWVLVFGGAGRWRHFVAYGLGGIAFSGALAATAWVQGYLPEMVRDAVLGSVSYASGEKSTGLSQLGKTVWELRGNVEALALAWVAFLGGATLVVAAWKRATPLQRRLGALGIALFLAQYACTFLAGHQLGHYHFPLGWSSALVAGMGAAGAGLVAAEEVGRVRWLGPALIGGLFAVTALPNPDVYVGILDLGKRRGEDQVDRLERLVLDNVPAEAPLFVLDDYAVSGVLSRLPNPPASRQVVFAIQCKFFDPADPPPDTTAYDKTIAGWGQGFIEELRREPPPYLVREKGIEDELSPWVASAYAEVASNEEFTVWRHRADGER